MGAKEVKQINLSDLKKPFPAKDIEWRIQSSGEKNGKIWAMCLAYVTNRAIQDRLDEVVGPENWQNQFKEGPGGGVLCGISIKVKDDWVTKWDGAENTNIEAIKGGLSDAMKRAGYQWSIGRYLYNLDAGFANVGDRGKYSAKTKNGQWFKWSPPALPKWALPEGEEPVKEEKKEEPKKSKEDAQANARAFFKTFLDNPKLTDDVKKYFENLKEGERFKISADNKWEIASIDAEITSFLLQETA